MTTTPDAPTATKHTDADPCPRVDVVVSNMPTDAATITVTRVWDDNKKAVVRGAKGASVSGDFSIVDYEAPLDIAVTYVCQTFDTSGTGSVVSDASTAVTLDSSNSTWLQDPLDPSSAVEVTLEVTADKAGLLAGSFASFSYAGAGSVQPVLGSSLPVGLPQPRQQPAMPIMIRTLDQTSADDVQSLLLNTNPLCVRTPDLIHPLLRLTYLMVGDVTQGYMPRGERTTWSFTGTSVRPPSLAVVIPVRTYGDVASEASTYAGLAALYATYLDLRRGIQV